MTEHGHVIAVHRKRSILLLVPAHKWNFERGSTADRNIFQRLGNKQSNIWVNKEQLLNLQQTTKSMSLYATKLMFKVLLSRQELINVAPKKMEGVGFVKMFGAKHFADFYGKPAIENCNYTCCKKLFVVGQNSN